MKAILHHVLLYYFTIYIFKRSGNLIFSGVDALAFVHMSNRAVSDDYFVGFDLGTSGARISVIAPSRNNHVSSFCEVHCDAMQYENSYDDPESWVNAIDALGPLRSILIFFQDWFSFRATWHDILIARELLD